MVDSMAGGGARLADGVTSRAQHHMQGAALGHSRSPCMGHLGWGWSREGREECKGGSPSATTPPSPSFLSSFISPLLPPTFFCPMPTTALLYFWSATTARRLSSPLCLVADMPPFANQTVSPVPFPSFFPLSSTYPSSRHRSFPFLVATATSPLPASFLPFLSLPFPCLTRPPTSPFAAAYRGN